MFQKTNRWLSLAQLSHSLLQNICLVLWRYFVLRSVTLVLSTSNPSRFNICRLYLQCRNKYMISHLCNQSLLFQELLGFPMQHLIHTFAWFDLSTKEHVIVENMYLFLKGSSSHSTLPQIHIFTDEFEIVGGFFWV